MSPAGQSRREVGFLMRRYGFTIQQNRNGEPKNRNDGAGFATVHHDTKGNEETPYMCHLSSVQFIWYDMSNTTTILSYASIIIIFYTLMKLQQ